MPERVCAFCHECLRCFCVAEIEIGVGVEYFQIAISLTILKWRGKTFEVEEIENSPIQADRPVVL